MQIPARPGYQVPFADQIRQRTGIMTGAVGMITSATQADNILGEDKADVVILAREFLRQPYWPLLIGSRTGLPGKLADPISARGARRNAPARRDSAAHR